MYLVFSCDINGNSSEIEIILIIKKGSLRGTALFHGVTILLTLPPDSKSEIRGREKQAGEMFYGWREQTTDYFRHLPHRLC